MELERKERKMGRLRGYLQEKSKVRWDLSGGKNRGDEVRGS